MKRRPPWWLMLTAAIWITAVAPARAHDARPAYLEISAVAAGRYAVLWRTPVLSGMRLPVLLRLPEGWHNVVEPTEQQLNDSIIERRVVDVGASGITGQRIEFVGLEASITDVVVRISQLDGTPSTTLVQPARPWIEIATAPGHFAVAKAFLVHGINHILSGFDHLLFVFGLLLLVRGGWMLVKTVTAFTLAHSITLALATLGVVHLSAPPVEASIALSILLLAVEIARAYVGQPSFAARWPWVVAFCFGLLHGFGFAGALAEIGLPQRDLPVALFTFNVGVETGQLIFVGAVLTVRALLLRLRLPEFVIRHARAAASYLLGTLAAFWFFERLQAFWT